MSWSPITLNPWWLLTQLLIWNHTYESKIDHHIPTLRDTTSSHHTCMATCSNGSHGSNHSRENPRETVVLIAKICGFYVCPFNWESCRVSLRTFGTTSDVQVNGARLLRRGNVGNQFLRFGVFVYQWIDIRESMENLQETMVFPCNIGGSCKSFLRIYIYINIKQ